MNAVLLLLSAMLKPLHLMTPAEKAALVARMKADGTYDDDFVGILGNLNNILGARPTRRKKPVARKPTKATA